MREDSGRNQYKVGKHFVLDINADSSVRGDRFDYRRDEEKIAAEAALDGLYVIRTSVPAEGSGKEHLCHPLGPCVRTRAWPKSSERFIV